MPITETGAILIVTVFALPILLCIPLAIFYWIKLIQIRLLVGKNFFIFNLPTLGVSLRAVFSFASFSKEEFSVLFETIFKKANIKNVKLAGHFRQLRMAFRAFCMIFNCYFVLLIFTTSAAILFFAFVGTVNRVDFLSIFPSTGFLLGIYWLILLFSLKQIPAKNATYRRYLWLFRLWTAWLITCILLFIGVLVKLP